MGFWTYYSPLWLGFLVTLLLHDLVGEAAPATWPESSHWPFVLAAAVFVGLFCQLLMIGVQGAFAQVLPFPVGRSIRGRSAVMGGLLIIACCGLTAVSALMHSDGMTGPATILGWSAVAAAVGILGIYFWSWPSAIKDFDGKI